MLGHVRICKAAFGKVVQSIHSGWQHSFFMKDLWESLGVSAEQPPFGLPSVRQVWQRESLQNWQK